MGFLISLAGPDSEEEMEMMKSAQNGYAAIFVNIVGQTSLNENYCKTRGIFLSRELKHFGREQKKEVPNNGTSF